MFDLSLAEMAVVGVVIVLAIGPKELPTVLRTMGRWLRRLKSLAAQFKQQFALLDEDGEMEKLKAELQENATYIKDAEGKLYRSYDISDLKDASRKPQMASSPESGQ